MNDGSSGLTIIYLAVLILLIASLWRLFDKAGQPGWASIIPIYNVYVLIKVAGRPGWWLILMFIPIVNIVIDIIVTVDVAKNFGKSGVYALGLIFLPFIFYPMLAFGEARYMGENERMAA